MSTNSPLGPGDAVTVLWFRDDMPHTGTASVLCSSQNKLAFNAEPDIKKDTWLILLARSEGRIFRAEGHCGPVVNQSGLWVTSLGKLNWTQADQRKSQRMPIELPITIKVLDASSKFQDFLGHTIDLSDCGALVRLPFSPPLHSLLRWELQLPQGPNASGLAMVARVAGELEVGLDFVEYVGNSRSLIAELLYDRAA